MKKLLLTILKAVCELLPDIQRMDLPKWHSGGSRSISFRGQGQTKKFGSHGSYRHK